MSAFSSSKLKPYAVQGGIQWSFQHYLYCRLPEKIDPFPLAWSLHTWKGESPWCFAQDSKYDLWPYVLRTGNDDLKEFFWRAMGCEKFECPLILQIEIPKLVYTMASIATDYRTLKTKKPTVEQILTIEHLESLFSSLQNYLGFSITEPIVWKKVTTFAQCPFLFEPNTLVVVPNPHHSTPNCYILESWRICHGKHGPTWMEINCVWYDFMGATVTQGTLVLVIGQFPGRRKVQKMPVFPLHLHPAPGEFIKSMYRKTSILAKMRPRGEYHYVGEYLQLANGGLQKTFFQGTFVFDPDWVAQSHPAFQKQELCEGSPEAVFGMSYNSLDLKKIGKRERFAYSQTVLGYAKETGECGEFFVTSIVEDLAILNAEMMVITPIDSNPDDEDELCSEPLKDGHDGMYGLDK